MIKLRRPRIHTSGSIITDLTRLFRHIGKPKKNGRLGRFFAKFMQEMRRE